MLCGLPMGGSVVRVGTSIHWLSFGVVVVVGAMRRMLVCFWDC